MTTESQEGINSSGFYSPAAGLRDPPRHIDLLKDFFLFFQKHLPLFQWRMDSDTEELCVWYNDLALSY